MLNIRKQISKLYLSSVLENVSLTGAWVAILAARGYSLVEIGFAETVFHIVSLIFEIPSGVLADVFGRKNMLIASNIMKMIGNIIMILSCNLFMVCTSIAFYAVSYNFSSGSGDALQVRTNTILQDMFPSEQRATLISVESFTFSMIMIVFSPLAGVLFSHW